MKVINALISYEGLLIGPLCQTQSFHSSLLFFGALSTSTSTVSSAFSVSIVVDPFSAFLEVDLWDD